MPDETKFQRYNRNNPQVRVKLAIKSRLEVLADDSGYTLTFMINEVLGRWLDKYDEKNAVDRDRIAK